MIRKNGIRLKRKPKLQQQQAQPSVRGVSV